VRRKARTFSGALSKRVLIPGPGNLLQFVFECLFNARAPWINHFARTPPKASAVWCEDR